MSAVLLVLSTALDAQSVEPPGPVRAWTAGVASTVGDGWQVQGVDVGVVRPVSLAFLRHYTLVVRLGSFVDASEIFGTQRGFIAGVALGGRTGSLTLAEVGHELSVSQLGFDVTVEVAGYVAANSPWPEGSSWLGAAVLPGLRFGRVAGMQVAIATGPALFMGQESNVHAFFGVRLEFPLVPR